jgi:hypothetical protein
MHWTLIELGHSQLLNVFYLDVGEGNFSLAAKGTRGRMELVSLLLSNLSGIDSPQIMSLAS